MSVCESWLKPSVLNPLLRFAEYNNIRNDNTGIRGGGVVILLKDKFTYKLLASAFSQYNTKAEYLCMWMTNIKLLLVVVNSPPSINYYNAF